MLLSIAETAAYVPDHEWADVLGSVLAIVALVSIPAVLVRRYAFGPRNAKGSGIIIPQYDPPAGVNLLEAAYLVNRGQSAVPAAIVDLAIRGNVRIVDAGGGVPKLSLELVNAAGIDAEERQLLRAFFPDEHAGSKLALDSDEVGIRALGRMEDVVHVGVLAKGWRRMPSSLDGVLSGWALVALLVVDLVTICLVAAQSPAANIALPPLILAVLTAFATHSRGFVLTPAGADIRDYLLGIRMYLQLAEADRLRILYSPGTAARDHLDGEAVVRLREKLLPYAVLFGIEQDWSVEVAGAYTAGSSGPTWYEPPHSFDSDEFQESMTGITGTLGGTPAREGDQRR